MFFGFCCINNVCWTVYNLCKWTCNHLKLKCMSGGQVVCMFMWNSAGKEEANPVHSSAKRISFSHVFPHLAHSSLSFSLAHTHKYKKKLVTAGLA